MEIDDKNWDGRYLKVFLKRSEEREVMSGFPFVFDNEISHLKFKNERGSWENISFDPSNENIRARLVRVCDMHSAEVYAKSGLFIGTAFLNMKSKIALRILSRGHAKDVFSDIHEFFRKRISDALTLRSLSFSEKTSIRLVFSEQDGLSGLIVDKYVSTSGEVILVTEFLSLFVEKYKSIIVDILKTLVHPSLIFNRSNSLVREKEGLPLEKGVLFHEKESPESTSRVSLLGSVSEPLTVEISLNGVRFLVDISNGQKTGYFLDQRENHLAIRKYSKGKRVLDCFSHTGSFALNAFFGGAKSVLAIDSSEEAVSIMEENIKLNGAEEVIKTRCEDVFLALREFVSMKETFDLIILDPPAFTKKAGNIDKAFSGYKEINFNALRLLEAGGVLVTCSCSAFFDNRTFHSMLISAAKDTKRSVQILEFHTAPLDHPALLGHSRGEYLKCFICRVMEKTR